MMKIEIRRAVCSYRFLAGAMIGIALAAAHFVMYTLPNYSYIDLMVKKGSQVSIFNQCLFNCFYTLPSELFFLLLPILAVLPYGDSFCTEKKSGYLRNVMTRTNKRNYYVAKYAAVFISGAFMVLIPMIVSMLATMCLFPVVPPERYSGQFPVTNTTLWNQLYISAPFIFTGLMILVTMIFAGLLACICLAVTDLFEKNFLILLFPFLLYLFSDYILGSLMMQQYSPYIYLKSGFVLDAKTSILAVEYGVLLIVTVVLFIGRGVKKEVY